MDVFARALKDLNREVRDERMRRARSWNAACAKPRRRVEELGRAWWPPWPGRGWVH